MYVTWDEDESQYEGTLVRVVGQLDVLYDCDKTIEQNVRPYCSILTVQITRSFL